MENWINSIFIQLISSHYELVLFLLLTHLLNHHDLNQLEEPLGNNTSSLNEMTPGKTTGGASWSVCVFVSTLTHG